MRTSGARQVAANRRACALIARRGIGPGQNSVQAGQQVARVGDTAAHGRVRPLTVPITVEAQNTVPPRRPPRPSPCHSARPATGRGSKQPRTISVVEGHPPPRSKRRVAGLPTHRAAAQPGADQIRPGTWAGSDPAALQLDGLLDHGQGVARRRPCGGGARRSPTAAPAAREDVIGQAGVDQQPWPRRGPRREQACSARRARAPPTRSRSTRPSPACGFAASAARSKLRGEARRAHHPGGRRRSDLGPVPASRRRRFCRGTS